MGDGLKRARAAAKASRTARCPVCGKRVASRRRAGALRIAPHGPARGILCTGTGLAAG